jgi:hypothetical protein
MALFEQCKPFQIETQSHSEDGAQIQCERGNFGYGHPEQRDPA